MNYFKTFVEMLPLLFFGAIIFIIISMLAYRTIVSVKRAQKYVADLPKVEVKPRRRSSSRLPFRFYLAGKGSKQPPHIWGQSAECHKLHRKNLIK